MSLGQSLDASLNSGQEIRFKQKHKHLMESLSTQVNLTYREIELLSIMYYKLQVTGDGIHLPIRKSLVNDLLHSGMDMTDFKYLPYIISCHDKRVGPTISLDSWIRMWALYLRGTLEEKIIYCYSVYKSMGVSEKLLRSNMIKLLKNSLIKDNNESDEEAIKDMVDLITKKMDHDRDSKISFEDFRTTVLKRPGFLETFGSVLPSRLAVYSFKQTVFENIRKK